MKINTTRFGEMEVKDEDVYTFPEGLLGFPDVRGYILIDNPGGGPFRWLQATEIPSLAFVVSDPTIYFKDYQVGIRKEDMESIELGDLSNGVVLVILTVPKEISDITANLQGPVLFNPEKKKGRQVVLSDKTYNTRHRIFPEKKS